MTRAWHWPLSAGLFFIAAAPTDAAAQAEGYPNKPVRFISDSAPGSSPDVGLRIVAEGLAQYWGQQIVVENRPGASGAISARAAAEAIPDGYTLYAPALSTFLALPGRAPNLPLTLPRDFIPIGFTFDQPMSIGVSPTLGVNTLPELIALAKTKPGQISYSVAGVGRMTHLTGELLQIRSDIKLQVVPYTGGAAQAPERYRRRPDFDDRRRLRRHGRHLSGGHAQGARGRLGATVAGSAPHPDGGGDAAGFCRRRLAGGRRAERHSDREAIRVRGYPLSPTRRGSSRCLYWQTV